MPCLRYACGGRQFPFDKQTINMVFVMEEGLHLYTCQGLDALSIMGLTEDNAQELLLPGTGTWYLDGGLTDAVSLRHPLDALGEPELNRCVVEVRIYRNYYIFFIKQVHGCAL